MGIYHDHEGKIVIALLLLAHLAALSFCKEVDKKENSDDLNDNPPPIIFVPLPPGR